MKNLFVIILLLGAVYFFYTRNSTPNIAAEQTDGHVVLSNEKFEWNFDLKEKWKAEGALFGIFHNNDDINNVFSGTFALIWGETAIELAAWDHEADLSANAKEVIAQYGCAADYLNKHTINFTAIGASKDIDKALRSADEHDELALTGYKAVVGSVSFKGNGQTLRRSGHEPVYVYVTGAKVNGEKFGEI